MTASRDDRSPSSTSPGGPSDGQALDDDTRALIDKIQHEYAPAPLTPTMKARMRQAVASRRDSGQRRWWAVAVTAAATVVLAAWMIWVRPQPSTSTTPPQQQAVTMAAADSWTDSVLFDELEEALSEDDDDADEDALPGEYQALAMLIDG